ncbi:MAG TPA: response regulator transcription factor [Denitromonas sp.]|uniref:response regulator transcription factor n=1 Tax=Denitromonas sp. TaxID=2734609 RepID=UPI001D4B0CD3|nr:response regulator transcription factor [Rhodocyclaceae bacterium]MCP5220722.1 response regulator transcription factor [Zoogloeaceae bacterium]HPR08890.1 response regulator transcription factor [Denitromonas sp.]HQU89750.1 response regulator transcription factor [Denitromonas sp.]HQV15732.1 response regulator transcription factor [Denitromonas sp.]
MTDARRPLIYIVEDDFRVAQLIEKTLLKFDFRCKVFSTGSDFLRQLRVQPPHITILDLGLPDMDGLQVVSQLRASYGFGLLIVTARADTHDRVLGLELGADDYVTKPFEPRELIARVRSVYRRYQANVASPLAAPKIARFANWRFDLATFSLVSPTGVETTLSQAEGQLLTVLLEHANQILSRDQLLDGRDVCALDRSIDLRISRLRRRLDENPQHAKLIKTVYGAGYLLAATVDWQ